MFLPLLKVLVVTLNTTNAVFNCVTPETIRAQAMGLDFELIKQVKIFGVLHEVYKRPNDVNLEVIYIPMVTNPDLFCYSIDRPQRKAFLDNERFDSL